MDQEGIYRKSGGNAQTKQVREGFEADSNYDISDPDLDIHSVTSAMKQYLRQLHVPLITHEAYQAFLDSGSKSNRALIWLNRC
jgi:Rho-type GTPase-activating protein 1/2